MKNLLIVLGMMACAQAGATEQCAQFMKFRDYPSVELRFEDRFTNLTDAGEVRVNTAAEAAAVYKEWCEVSKRPSPRIGMSAKTATNWGNPKSVNRTTTARGVREQWVYGDGNYLYFENGRLVAIQN